MDAKTIAGFIRTGAYRIGHEALLQEDLERHFRNGCIPYEREVRLSDADRVDFVVDGHIAVELKIKESRRRILRQLERYAAHDVITGLILLSGVSMGIPARLNGKPVHFIHLGRMSLGC